MTPTETAAPDPLFDTAFDQSFDSDSATATDDATVSSGEAEDGGLVATEEESSEQTADGTEETAPEEQAEGQQQEDTLEEGVQKSENGKGYQVSKGRMDGFQRAKKFYEEISEFAPTVQEAREHYEHAADFRALWSDFRDPERIDNFIRYWEGESPESLKVLATKLGDRLGELNPEYHKGLQSKALESYWDSEYSKALESGDAQKLYEVRQRDYSANGTWRQDDQIAKLKRDPLADRQADLDRREREHEQRLTRGHDQFWSGVENNIGQAKQEGLNQAIDAALKPAKDSGSYSEGELNAFRLAIRAEVEKQLESDIIWSRDMGIDLRGIKRSVYEALKSGGKVADLNPTIHAYVQNHIVRAQAKVPAIANKLVSAAGQRKVADNKQAHQRAEASQKRGISGSGSAPRRGVPLPKGNSFDEKFDAFWG